MNRKRVLIAVLDWGLGHATRCIPIINVLLELDCVVDLAGSGSSLTLLGKQFPHLKSFELPAYNPVYPKSGSMTWAMLKQSPKFISIIKKEHDVIERIVNDHEIDVVISDNRYGCWSASVTSVFITHQLTILMSQKWRWLQGIVNGVNQHCIEKFSVCWVPDYPERRLAGKLSSNEKIEARYIGPLSRFEKKIVSGNGYEIVVILSGPEPQRTVFESILIPQLLASPKKALLIRGVMSADKSNIGSSENLEVVDYLSAHALNEVVSDAELIIARSGYSTIMDMAKLGKKVIFVPTPGQTEQEYLARIFKEAGVAFSVEQEKFSMQQAISATQVYFGFNDYAFDDQLLRTELSNLLKIQNPIMA